MFENDPNEHIPDEVAEIVAELAVQDKVITPEKRYIIIQLDPQVDPADQVHAYGPYAADVVVFEMDQMRREHDKADLGDVILAIVPMAS